MTSGNISPNIRHREQQNSEQYTNELESKKRIWRNIGIAALTAAAGVVVGVVVMTNMSSDKVMSNLPSKFKGFGDPNPAITSVVIDNGARLRNDPTAAPDINNLVDTADTTMVVDANNDIIPFPDKNDPEWFGVPASSLQSVDKDLDMAGDKDGIIWVSRERATAQYSGNENTSAPIAVPNPNE